MKYRDNSDIIGAATVPLPLFKSSQIVAKRLRREMELPLQSETVEPVLGPLIPVSLPNLAVTLGLTTRACSQLCVEGIVIRLDRGEYDLVQSVKNYIEKMRKPEAGVKEKLIAAQLGLAEVKLSQAKGELVPADQVQAKWDSILRTLRSSFMGIPARVQEHLPHLTAHDVSTIDSEIRDTLTEMGEDHAND